MKMIRCIPFFKTCNRQVDYIDKSYCSLTTVPEDIMRFRNTLEELYLNSNHIRELPRVSSTLTLRRSSNFQRVALILPWSSSGFLYEISGVIFGCFSMNLFWSSSVSQWFHYDLVSLSIGFGDLLDDFSTKNGWNENDSQSCTIVSRSLDRSPIPWLMIIENLCSSCAQESFRGHQCISVRKPDGASMNRSLQFDF